MISVVPAVTAGTNKFPLVVGVPQDPVSKVGQPPEHVDPTGEHVLDCINLPFTQTGEPEFVQVPGVVLHAATETPQDCDKDWF